MARGRILPRKQPDEISEAPPYQAKKQADQSRAPSRAETKEPDLLNAEKEPDSKKDSQKQEFEDLQTKTMTATSSGANGNSDGKRTRTRVYTNPEAHNPNSLSDSQGRGQPLPENLQAKMEKAIGTDFKDVRLHHDAQSATMAENLGAKAFTHKADIYFNQGEYQPETTAGEELLAHELTHVKQQKTIPGLQSKLQVPVERDRYEREADAVADTVVGSSYQPMENSISASMSANSSLNAHNGGDSIQLKAKPGAEADSDSNWFLEQVSGLVRNIPGYDLLSLVIGRDPLTGKTVNGDGPAWGKSLAGLLPGGALLFANLEKAGVITRAVAWLKAEIEKLGITFAVIKDLFDQAWSAIVGPKSPEKEPEPEKKGWFGRLAEGAKDLASKAISIGSVLFTPEETFNKLKGIFLPPIDRTISFVSNAGSKLMEFTFEGALTLAKAPVKQVMTIFNKGKDVLQQIISDPIGFLSNLLKAIHGGLHNFKDKIVTYLQSGLAGWLFGALNNVGITLPEKLNPQGIFSLIAQILGVTWQAIKARVIKLLGPKAEKVMDQVKKAVAVVADFITRGPIALFEMAKDFLGDLKTRFFDSMIEWVRMTIIFKGVQKLISMFNPVGAIVQAIITIGSTIKFFIDRAKQITAFANAVFDSITEIAAGNLKKAVIAVENSLAKALPVAIGFMANLAGIGGIVAKIKDVIKKLRKPIDKAVEKVVGFVADQAKAFMRKSVDKGKTFVESVKGKTEEVIEWWKIRKRFKARDGKEHSIFFEGKDENAQLMIASQKMRYTEFINRLKPKDEAHRQLQNEALAIGKEIDIMKKEVSRLHRQYQDPQKDKAKKEQADQIQKTMKGKVNELSLKLIPLIGTEIPEKRYLPKGYDVRRFLYINGSGFPTLSKKLRIDKANEINKKLAEIQIIKDIEKRKLNLNKLREKN